MQVIEFSTEQIRQILTDYVLDQGLVESDPDIELALDPETGEITAKLIQG